MYGVEGVFASVGDGAAAVAVAGVGVKSSGSWRMDLEDTAGVNVDSHSCGSRTLCKQTTELILFVLNNFLIGMLLCCLMLNLLTCTLNWEVSKWFS